uniref:Fork-head domain-containing protein n=1 Tax=Oncorhynchus tshawytscha TaxID=74940 RepID=A0AAZ3RDM1_ONCTS
MSTDSPSSTFTPSANRFWTLLNNQLRNCIFISPQCEESSSVSFTTAQRERESATYRQRNAVAESCRRHSVDGAMVGQSQRSNLGSGTADRFHPYRHQFSDDGVGTGCLAPGAPGNTSSAVTMCVYVCMRMCTCVCVCSLQFSPGMYSTSGQSKSSQYSLQCLSTPTHQDSSMQSLFPKPIYSYSILIFMALRNSKTGSLPVSEIYRFMTEHFPYFKTAPDGWKNSVRHNLSLNKCFEKVENKIGNSSRKGCLWALNPAKIEKMQEELHKWRRKDPLTVRKSMARPEDLDRLLGERPEKLKSLPSYHNQIPTPSSFTSHPPEPCHPLRLQQHPRYLPPTTPQPFSFYSPCRQQPLSGIPPNVGTLGSPLAGQTPATCSATIQAEYDVGPRSIQELQLDEDASNDIDTLNPSLTDLQLHGKDERERESERPRQREPYSGMIFYTIYNKIHNPWISDGLASYLTSMGNTPIPLL